MTQIKNRRMIARQVTLARRALWLLLLLLPFSVMPAAANSVSMVCNRLFDVERMRGEITETETFDGSVYVTVDLDGGDVMSQRLLKHAWGLSCAAFGSGIDKRLDKQVFIRW